MKAPNINHTANEETSSRRFDSSRMILAGEYPGFNYYVPAR